MTSTGPIRSLALVIPAYNEAEGLPHLFEALRAFRTTLPQLQLRVMFVDDHSSDNTPAILRQACSDTPWFSFIRMSRRSGSHTAILAGLGHCDEDCAAFIAADLQDPLDLLGRMVELCNEGHDVVWATRQNDAEFSRFEAMTSRLFYVLMNKLSNVDGLPMQASFALLSKRAYRNLVANIGQHPSLVVDIPRLGYSVATIPFHKVPRSIGTSKWTLGRKLLHVADAVVTSSCKPLRAMIFSGMAFSLTGLFYALFLIIRWFNEPHLVEGWTSLMVGILIMGGLQMLMLGVIGEYVWRTSESVRRHALYFIEDSCIPSAQGNTGNDAA